MDPKVESANSFMATTNFMDLKSNLNKSPREPVAIVGMAVRVPGARTLEQFWSHLEAGRDCLDRPSQGQLERAGVKSETISNPAFVGSIPQMDGIEHFDADFFGINRVQAELTDPSHRVFLECVWEAMEHAGIIPGEGDNLTGVFAGVEGDYDQCNLTTEIGESTNQNIPRVIGNSMEYLTLRVSHELNLVGPSFSSVAACATSLLAVHTAVQNLRLGDCSVAIAGGSRVEVSTANGYISAIDGMLSPSGVIRPFDAKADGTVFGQGTGVVVLKRLKDAIKDGNQIHGVILGTGFSNDGKPDDKKSFIAPAASGQARAIRKAIQDAGISPRTIGLNECHGTATLAGDPIEVQALNSVHREAGNEKGYCALSSIKGNVGHLGAAAGVVSLIKTCLSLSKGEIAPIANFDTPNEEIDFESSPFFVANKKIDWQTTNAPRRAGVSAFGFGGANAHVVVEEYRPSERKERGASDRSHHLWVISAKSPIALRRRIADLAIFMEQNPKVDLGDVAHTLRSGRKAMAFRTSLIVSEESREDIPRQLRSSAPVDSRAINGRPLIFLFPGQGAQGPGMGALLYDREPIYRETIDYCADFIETLTGQDLRPLIHGDGQMSHEEVRERLKQTSVAQPALFVVEYALAQVYLELGIQFGGMLGHSLGELVAACLAGVYSLDDGLRMICLRSSLVQDCPTGSMLAVMLSRDELLEVLPEGLEIAAENYPAGCVVSGPDEEIEKFQELLSDQRVGFQALETSHAFHSRMLDPAEEKFRADLEEFKFRSPEKLIVSNVTGRPLDEEEAKDPAYWASQMRQQVRFSEGLQQFPLDDHPVFLELGPGSTLSGFVSRHDSKLETLITIPSISNSYGFIDPLENVGKLWELGTEVDWSCHEDGSDLTLLPLPTYPFQSRYHWKNAQISSEGLEYEFPLPLYEFGWTEKAVSDDSIVEHSGPWIVFADRYGFADSLVSRLKETGSSVIRVSPGDSFEEVSEFEYLVKPGCPSGFEALATRLAEGFGEERVRALHFWTITGTRIHESELDAFEACVDDGFFSLLYLVRGAASNGFANRMDVQVFTDGIAAVDPKNDRNLPEKGLLLGPSMVLPMETIGLTLRCVDISLDSVGEISAQLREEIVKEFSCDSRSNLVALRPDGRYAQQLFEMPDLPKGRPRLRPGGTVLLTGAMGALGLRVAEHLYHNYHARLILTSRWEVPSKEEWPLLIAEGGKIGNALRVLSQLEEMGAEFHIIQTDTSDRESFLSAVAQAETRFGTIHGVVHAAGVVDPAPALDKSRERIRGVFDSKVLGALILEEIFKDRELDMLIHFSSVASSRATQGQVDYAGANAILDRIAMRRQSSQHGISVSIGWGPWRDAGMAWAMARHTEAFIDSLESEKEGIDLAGPPISPDHPLLREQKNYVDGDALFSGSFSVEKDWVAKEHMIQGSHLLSGTTIWEMFRAGFACLHPEVDAIELSKIAMLSPFLIDGESVFELLFTRTDDGYQVELRSRTMSSPGWSNTAIAQVCALDSAKVPVLQEHCRDALQRIGKAALSSEAVTGHGERWQCEWAMEEAKDGLAFRSRLSDEFHEEAGQYGLHPSLFDRSIHLITEQHRYGLIPYTCETMRIFGDLGWETTSFGRSIGAESNDAFHIVVADIEGQPLVELDGYVTRTMVGEKVEKLSSSVAKPEDGFRSMVLTEPGSLDSFKETNRDSHPLPPDCVRIAVRAAGLNFRDVLWALGQMPKDDNEPTIIGSECSGIVTEVGADVHHVCVGDRVVAIAGDCFATEVIAEGHSVASLPADINYVSGAGIPLTFMTVDLALNRQAQLQADERILIHSGAGGIGLAAIQMAQNIGAEIFATAGSESKRDYLKSLGVDHVMDSRSLDFAEEVMKITDGEGIDVILNALAGEYISTSLELLRPFGRFVEIGKKDVFANYKLGLFPFRRNLSYFCVDLGQLGMFKKAEFRERFGNLMQKFAMGDLHPSPVRTFPLSEISEGFKLVAQAKHIGKVVFTVSAAKDGDEERLERFLTEYGKGIPAQEGLDMLSRLISSDETPHYLLVSGNPIGVGDTPERFEANQNKIRPVDTIYREPETPTEEKLVSIWEATLGISPIGVDDDFTALGGDSINAIMIQVVMEKRFEMPLPFSVLFRHPTIAKLGVVIDGEAKNSTN